jgi:hypothetical protein
MILVQKIQVANAANIVFRVAFIKEIPVFIPLKISAAFVKTALFI